MWCQNEINENWLAYKKHNTGNTHLLSDVLTSTANPAHSQEDVVVEKVLGVRCACINTSFCFITKYMLIFVNNIQLLLIRPFTKLNCNYSILSFKYAYFIFDKMLFK